MKRQQIVALGRTLLLVLLLVVAAGCGGRKAATVRGKVTYKGAHLTMGNVIILSDDKASARGQIGPDGTYEVLKAPTGKVKVGVSNPPPPGAPGGQPLSGPPDDPENKQAAELAKKYVASPDSYTNPEKSGLSFDIPSGGKQLDIDLTGTVSAPGGRGGPSASGNKPD